MDIVDRLKNPKMKDYESQAFVVWELQDESLLDDALVEIIRLRNEVLELTWMREGLEK